MAVEIWVNIGSANGLLPDGTKPLPETNVDWSSRKSSDIHIRAISQEMPQASITKIHLKITYLKLHSNIPGGSELSHRDDLVRLDYMAGHLDSSSSNGFRTTCFPSIWIMHHKLMRTLYLVVFYSNCSQVAMDWQFPLWNWVPCTRSKCIWHA